jgi:hypothetical protein
MWCIDELEPSKLHYSITTLSEQSIHSNPKKIEAAFAQTYAV